MKKKLAGIIIIVLTLGTLAFWELWGRENISYRSILVLSDSAAQNTVITESMLREKKVEKFTEGALQPFDAKDIVGKTAKQFIKGGTELFPEYFCETKFLTGEQSGKYVFSLPENWVISFPESIQRGDKALFYLDGEFITECLVIHVRDSTNSEITYDQERLHSSAIVSRIEVLLDRSQAELLGTLSARGRQFVILFEQEK